MCSCVQLGTDLELFLVQQGVVSLNVHALLLLITQLSLC